MELNLNVPNDHCIVDRKDLEITVEFFVEDEGLQRRFEKFVEQMKLNTNETK